ncbi:MAG: type II secretion system F family protein [Planctomycetota bacterium]|nr:type II secretion system F family protein [Planctomycetota bacterium]
MPIYEWKGFDSKGRKAGGVVDADSPRDARVKCKRQGSLVRDIDELRGGRKVKKGEGGPVKRKKGAAPAKKDAMGKLRERLSAARGRDSGAARSKKRVEEVSTFVRQLATLTRAGIPITEALRAIIEQTAHKRLNVVYRDIRERIAQGAPTADALSAHPDYFDALAVAMIRAGEASGHLDDVLLRLANYMQRQTRTRNKVVAAMTYPAIMLVVGLLVVSILITFVVPKITTMLESQNQALPLPTRILVGASEFFRELWWIPVLVFVLGLASFNLYYSTEKGRLAVDGRMLKVPLFGDLLRKQAISRFAQTFSTLLRSGVSVVRCLEINRSTLGNRLMEKTVDEVRERILEGQDIATPIKASGVFPPLVGYMIAVGEQSGELDNMMSQVADSYEEEVDLAIQRFTSLIEPALIITLASLVGFIILAILLPVLQLTQSF